MIIPHVPFLSFIFCYFFLIHHSVYYTGVLAQIVEDQQQSLLKLKLINMFSQLLDNKTEVIQCKNQATLFNKENQPKGWEHRNN